MMLVAFALLVATADASDAKIVEVSGDVEVTVSSGGRALSTDKGTADVNVSGDRVVISVPASSKGEIAVSFGTSKLDQIIAKNGARVVVTGFAGKSLDISVAGGSHVRVSGAKGADSLRIEGAGTSRVDADELSVDTANVTLKDAARAEIKVTKSLTCDLQRASRLVVKGKPAKVDKKVAGVAKLELK